MVIAGRKNVEALSSKLEKAEHELSELALYSMPTLQDGDGENLMEITEELDDDDNVICKSFVKYLQAF